MIVYSLILIIFNLLNCYLVTSLCDLPLYIFWYQIIEGSHGEVLELDLVFVDDNSDVWILVTDFLPASSDPQTIYTLEHEQ